MANGVWIESRKRGWYQVRWRHGGKKHASQVYTNRKDADDKAEAVRSDLAAERDARRAARGVALSIEALLLRWSASRIADGAVRATYAEEVCVQIRKLAKAYEWQTVRDITAEALDRWRASVPAGRGTDKPLASIKSVLNWAHRALRQPVDLAVLSMPPRRRPSKLPPRLLTDSEYASVLARARRLAGERVSLLLECLATYGWRPIDACKLTCGSVDVGGVTLKPTKNGNQVRHPLMADHAARMLALAADRGHDEPLFLDPWNRPWRISKLGQAEGLSSWYKANIGEVLFGSSVEVGAAAKAETGRTGIYLLKDRAISAMEDAQIDDRTKAAFTGHKTLRVFDHYRATNPQRALAALAKLTAKAKKKSARTVPAPKVVSGAQERN